MTPLVANPASTFPLYVNSAALVWLFVFLLVEVQRSWELKCDNEEIAKGARTYYDDLSPLLKRARAKSEDVLKKYERMAHEHDDRLEAHNAEVREIKRAQSEGEL